MSTTECHVIAETQKRTPILLRWMNCATEKTKKKGQDRMGRDGQNPRKPPGPYGGEERVLRKKKKKKFYVFVFEVSCPFNACIFPQSILRIKIDIKM